MVMGTLANLYAIQQTFSTADKNIIETKDIILADSLVKEIANKQVKDKSTYTCTYYTSI